MADNTVTVEKRKYVNLSFSVKLRKNVRLTISYRKCLVNPYLCAQNSLIKFVK